MDCLILGDSLAVGISQYSKCDVHAKNGITSSRFIEEYGITFNSKMIIISLGSNDYRKDTYDNLLKLRKNISADCIYWIIPYYINKKAVLEVAKQFKDDIIIEMPGVYMQKDKVHPTGKGYQYISDILGV